MTATVVQTYDCGAVANTVTATLYSDGSMIVTGTGAIDDYTTTTMPWYSNLSSITKLYIDNGITEIGDYAFANATNITNIVMKCNPPTLGTTPLTGISNVDIQYDPLLETWTDNIMTTTYGGATGVTWSTPLKYLLTIEGLQYFWEKCKVWINTALGNKVSTSSVGQANGVASLDSTGKVPSSQLPTSGGSVVVSTDWSDITNKPSTFPPSTHTHAISDVTNLSDELNELEYNLATHSQIDDMFS